VRNPRNPFLMRASEQIASDATFLKLFGPGALEVLPEQGVFDGLHILQSAPGGGKTSLLRVFTPNCLVTLHAYRAHEDYKELYQRLKALGALDDSGPVVLGVMLSCGQKYAALEDMFLDEVRKDRLLFCLLNCRIILAALRGALALRRLSYPEDLTRLQMHATPEQSEQLSLPASGRGNELHEWAREVERSVYESLDSLEPEPALPKIGHENLHSLDLIKEAQITIDGAQVAQRVLIMLDDVHKLARRQRHCLIRGLLEFRNTASVWIAERLEALGTSELLDEGATANRDYSGIISLESFWRRSTKRFETTVRDIAKRRAQAATDVEIESFEQCLQNTMDRPEWVEKLQRSLEAVSSRVKSKVDAESRFEEWVRARESFEGTLREKLVAWRSVEILIEREKRSRQLSFGFPLSASELEKKDDSAVKAAAEVCLMDEFKLPYYFGFPRLVSIASSNIEQFLALSSDLFEEAISAALMRRPYDLPPDRQEVIIRRLASGWWEEELPRRVPHAREVRTLVGAIANYARSETYQPNAPYSPGVTGIAITMEERDRLRDPSFLESRPDAGRLAAVLGSCLAHNILEPMQNYRQGYKYWMVLYLNRLLCVYFGLPLDYGGWRPKRVNELCQWLQDGFRPKKARERLL